MLFSIAQNHLEQVETWLCVVSSPDVHLAVAHLSYPTLLSDVVEAGLEERSSLDSEVGILFVDAWVSWYIGYYLS